MAAFVYLILALLTATLWPSAPDARAGTFDVYPIRVHLESESPTAALTLRNTGAESVVVHVELMKWTGKDQQTPSQDLLVNPPIFTIPPKSSQVVRLGMSEFTHPREELAYRVYLQEVPPRPSKGMTVLQTALRIGIPIFIPPRAPQRAIQWTATRARDGTVRVQAVNRGNVHVQLLHLKLDVPETSTLNLPVRDYLLPGQSGEWSLGKTSRWKKSGLKLTARTDGDDLNATLLLEDH